MRLRFLLILLPTLLICSCSSDYLAPISERDNAPNWRPREYQIKPGDTLYSIAWEFGLDYRELARWNHIAAPHKIVTGSQLALSAPTTSNQRNTQTKHYAKTGGSPPQRVTTTATKKKYRSTTTANRSTKVRWHWPTTGNLIATFSPKLGHNRGLNIAGKLNQPIKAAASGVVVYAGEGLKSYGKMIIVKHSEQYLSAYANNNAMNVREGQRVNSGETIARMGRRNDGKTMLHFEIRRNGKPVDPQKYLPKRS